MTSLSRLMERSNLRQTLCEYHNRTYSHGCVLHLVQDGNWVLVEHWKKKAKKFEDMVKKYEEILKQLESEKEEEKEQYEGELGVVLWNSVNTMQTDWDTHTRLGQCCLHSCIWCVHRMWKWWRCLCVSIVMNFDETRHYWWLKRHLDIRALHVIYHSKCPWALYLNFK